LARALVEKHGVDPEKAGILATLANGSYARATELKDSDRIARRNWLIEETAALDTNPENARLAFAEKLAREKDEVAEALEIMETWFRDLLIARYRFDKILNADLAEKIREMSKRVSENELVNRIEAVRQAQKAIDSNANPRLALENLVANLAERA
jgi:DNA polymerase-3 subunit delta'